MLPTIPWKFQNLGQLAKLCPKEFRTQAEELERLLGYCVVQNDGD
jgi:hypothetical protein